MHGTDDKCVKNLGRNIHDVPEGKVNILGGPSVGHSKEKSVLFRTVPEIEIFHCTAPKLLVRNRYYVLFLIPAFIVQGTTLVQITYYNTFSKIPPSTSLYFATRVRT
jgi:hypothetical protein